jgi:nitroreductase
MVMMMVGAQEIVPGLKPILDNWGERSYVPGRPASADLNLIIQAGIRTPSAGNRQPWHFTVVQTYSLVKQIIPDAIDGNVIVVISSVGDGKTNGRQILDCALAAENIYLAAQALGYGSRIYTGPVDQLNNNLKDRLALPAGHNAVVLVRIGKIQPPVDALSRASSRKNGKDIVTYK